MKALKIILSFFGLLVLILVILMALRPKPTPFDVANLTIENRPLCEILADVHQQSGAPAMAIMTANSAGVTQICVAGVRANGDSALLTKDDVWHLGSNSKAMTAALIGRYVSDGKARWDDRLGDIIGAATAGEYADVTYRDLLTHRSGLTANAGLKTTMTLLGTDRARDVKADRETYVKAVLAKPRGAEGFSYSNAGYTLAAHMLEVQQDSSFEHMIETRLFATLGMESAGFGPPGIAGIIDQPRGHMRGLFFGRLKPQHPPLADNPPAINSAGRAHMNLTDYSKFLIDQMRGANGADGTFLPPNIYGQLHRPNGDYAMGWGVSGDGTLSHSGSNTMWLVSASIFAKHDLIVVVAANEGRIGHLQPYFKALENAARR